jgi:hypothetical protein
MTETTGIEAALDEAAQWVGQIPGVAAVGQGSQDGMPTVDVWVTGVPTPHDLPEQLHGHLVRVLDAGGSIQAQDDHPE